MDERLVQRFNGSGSTLFVLRQMLQDMLLHKSPTRATRRPPTEEGIDLEPYFVHSPHLARRLRSIHYSTRCFCHSHRWYSPRGNIPSRSSLTFSELSTFGFSVPELQAGRENGIKQEPRGVLVSISCHAARRRQSSMAFPTKPFICLVLQRSAREDPQFPTPGG